MFLSLRKTINLFPAEVAATLPSNSPHEPARVRVNGTCPRHGADLFKLRDSKTICACDSGCMFEIGTMKQLGGF